MDKYKLSQNTIEKLGSYVYLLIDPRNNKIFYVGKGKGNRINKHLLWALDGNTKETEKIKRIKEIQSAKLEVKHTVLRHELTDKEALEVESAVIDVLWKDNLTNIVKGHNSEDKGIMELEDIKIKYEAEEANIEEPAIIFSINNFIEEICLKKKFMMLQENLGKLALVMFQILKLPIRFIVELLEKFSQLIDGYHLQK